MQQALTYVYQVIIVGIGGFFGASARYIVSGLTQQLIPASTFPLGTLVVNVTGSLLLGFFAGQMEIRQLLGPSQRLFLLVGVLGGYTTFSTFAFETLSMTHSAEFLKATVNLCAHIILGMIAVWIGYQSVQAI